MGRVNEGGMHFVRYTHDYQGVYAEYREEAEHVRRKTTYVPPMHTSLFTMDGCMIIDLRGRKARGWQ